MEVRHCRVLDTGSVKTACVPQCEPQSQRQFDCEVERTGARACDSVRRWSSNHSRPLGGFGLRLFWSALIWFAVLSLRRARRHETLYRAAEWAMACRRSSTVPIYCMQSGCRSRVCVARSATTFSSACRIKGARAGGADHSPYLAHCLPARPTPEKDRIRMRCKTAGWG